MCAEVTVKVALLRAEGLAELIRVRVEYERPAHGRENKRAVLSPEESKATFILSRICVYALYFLLFGVRLILHIYCAHTPLSLMQQHSRKCKSQKI